MKIVSGLLFIGILGAAVAAQSDGPAASPASSDTNATTRLPGQEQFEREIQTASEQYERAKLRFTEATERARLNYVKVLEDNLSDLVTKDARAAEFERELTRVRSLKFHSPKYEFKTYTWEHNAAPVKMIHKEEGFCYLADIGGAFNGGGEVARVYVGDDGFWYLHGSTGQGFLVVRAIAVKMTR
ncbi:MAG: hypothetical protein ACKV2Q_14025 [Planctomycetaceae bacterium]